MCPNESTMFSRARMRFAVTSSSISWSSLAIRLPSQNEAHRAERAELMGVDEHAPLLDLKGATRALEDVAVRSDIFPDALKAAVTVADEIGRNRNEIAIHAGDAHVGDHAAGTRLRRLGVTVGIEHADDALADALAIVGNEEESVAMVALGLIVGRNVI